MHPLGNIRKTYGINLIRVLETYVLLAVLAVIFIFVILNVVQADLTDGPLIAIFCFACTLPFLPFYYLRCKRRVAVFTVYDQGIGVTLNGDEKRWRWKELTSFVAPDQKTFVGAFTLQMGYVSCDYFAGSTLAFRIDRWTTNPYEIIHFLCMKIIEFTLAAPRIEAYERGEALDFGSFKLSRQGISTMREVIPWSEIQSVEFREQSQLPPPQIYFWIQRGGQQSNLGEITYGDAYLLMALVDHIRGTDHLKTAQEERLRPKSFTENQQVRQAAIVGLALVAFLLIERLFPTVSRFLDNLP